jgi:Fe-only nitrogenase accessory protein AnfO
MKIAVFVDKNGNSLPFYADGILKLYVYEKDEWTCTKEIPIELHNTLNIAEIRTRILSIVYEIEDCKMLVVAAIKGFPHSLFTDKGIDIWEFKGVLAIELLDHIKEQVHKLKEEKVTTSNTPILKGAIQDGIYEINLAEILENDSSLTSKNILKPFFQNTEFKKLEFICNHIPKWFDKEFATLKLEVRVEESTDGLCHAVVSSTGIRSIQMTGPIDEQQASEYNEKISTTLKNQDDSKCGGSCRSNAGKSLKDPHFLPPVQA